MARAYPNSQFCGFDFHPASIATARERAAEASVEDRTTFEVATAKTYTGTYDLIYFFDCLHDMGDPVGVAAQLRDELTAAGYSGPWDISSMLAAYDRAPQPFAFPIVEAPGGDNQFWCLTANPSCTRDPWWVEWNERQTDHLVQYVMA